MKSNVDINAIQIDYDIQLRESTNTDLINEYAEKFDELPPLKVFYDGSKFWLADGFHRIAAAKKIERKKVLCEVEDGTKRDAILYACGANANHGLRRTNEDKRRAVERLLRDEEWSKWSNRRIAQQACVSDMMVKSIRDQVQDSCTSSQTRVGKDGKEYKAPVSRPKETAPVEPVEPAVESTEPEVYDVWEEVEPPEPKNSKVDQFRKLRSMVKQHANQMIRAVDDMQVIRCNPGTHKKLLALFESIHSLVDGWPE